MNYSKNIIYEQNIDAWERYPFFIKELIEQFSPSTVCDLGGGANPLFSLDFIVKQHFEYTVLDISQTELEKLPSGYKTRVDDIEFS